MAQRNLQYYLGQWYHKESGKWKEIGHHPTDSDLYYIKSGDSVPKLFIVVAKCDNFEALRRIRSYMQGGFQQVTRFTSSHSESALLTFQDLDKIVVPQKAKIITFADWLMGENIT